MENAALLAYQLRLLSRDSTPGDPGTLFFESLAVRVSELEGDGEGDWHNLDQ